MKKKEEKEEKVEEEEEEKEDEENYCTPPKECCTLGCCYLYSQPTPNIFNLIIWNHWYLWCVIVVGVCVCCGVCACGVWRRKSHASRGGGGGGGVRGGGGGGGGGGRGGGGDACSEVDSQSAGSCYQPPPHYSRCSSFHQPPPYNEVTSKPDLYPLVISYSDTGKTNVGGSYLMVHYFRNYIMRPVVCSG
ncbi:hypothetical protein LSTR_LSTR014391 [Laodelphax striatellus]|uniref:WW domain binding protein VOPP1 n=1 Tax=Laodelphax striatellus TaxID=195883 RepID=A0A482WG76_LAOST|nr:hypothetical protein LSTR_LSTR014391 [Laodelphax striatellus]